MLLRTKKNKPSGVAVALLAFACFAANALALGAVTPSFLLEEEPWGDSSFSSIDTTRRGAQADTIHELDMVEITAHRPVQVVISPQEIGVKAIKRLNSLSVADAMRYFSGVQVKDYGGIGGIKTINIRSMGSHHVGVFYDGVELSNAQNGQVDLGQYSLDNMESISLYAGQKSHYIQPAKDFGSSGSVYLKTRRPIFTNGKNTNLRATFKTGSFALLNPSLLFEYRLATRLSISFNAELLQSDGRYKFRYRRVKPFTHELAYDTTAVRENGDINGTRLEGTLFGTYPKGNYTMKLYNYNSERGVPGAIVNNVWRRGERIWDTNSFLQGTTSADITDRYRVSGVLKYAHFRTHYVNNDDKLFHVDNLYKQQEFYLSGSQSFLLLPGWYVAMAYDYQWNKLTGDMRGFVHPIRHTHMLAASTTYASDWIDVQGSLLGTFVNDFVEKIENPPRYRKLTPAVMLSLHPIPGVDLRLNAFYKESFRMPTFNDLYYADIGNSKLFPEQTKQLNIGLAYNIDLPRYSFRRIEASVDGYRNRVKDKIVAYPKGQQFRWTILNLGKVDIKGIDAALTFVMVPARDLSFRLRLQYTHQKAIDITNPQDSYYQHQIPYIPRHSGSGTMMATYKTWQFNYSFIYVGERYNQQENIPYNYTQPWYTSDLSLAKDFQWGRYNVRLQIECNNLLNQDYDVIINYPMPGRNWRITTTWQL